MILFAGEYIRRPANFSIKHPSTPLINGNWKTVRGNNALIHYCDFSPRKTHSILDEKQFVALSGNPVVINSELPEKSQLEKLSIFFSNNRLDQFLKNSNGVFCSICLDIISDELVLATDHIGLRQIYLYQDDERTIFANALWLITEIIGKSLDFDIDSIVEIGTLGYPLDNRTKFKEIQPLPPGSTLELTPSKTATIKQYFDLTAVQPQNHISTEEAVRLLYDTWKTVVSDRLDGQREVFGFLSGGMDSRLLLHTLKSLGCDIYSANFAPQGTRDLVFGEMASASIGTTHFHYPIDNPEKDLAAETIRAWRTAEPERSAFFKNNPMIWSGDGGSVGMGHVYLTDQMSLLAAQNNFTAAAELFCKENNRHVPFRLFKDKSTMSRFVERIASTMSKCGITNAERAPYYFLMLNDQRRHMDRHYESFHERGFDFSLPFFDKRLISLVSSLPANWVNNHRLYDKMFNLIGGSLTATVWQTYPGHMPCPHTIPTGLIYQWEPSFYSSKNKKRAASAEARACLMYALNNSSTPFSRLYTIFALTLTTLGLSNHGYITKYIKPLT